MFRIRLHGRGGQGIKTAGQVLGSAFFLEGYEVQDAPRYGAERRGAPIFAYVRAGRDPIHERGVITRPDLVVVADETLVPVPAAGVLLGISAHSVLLIASAEPAQVWRERLKLEGPLLTMPVAAEAPALGLACAAAAARLVGVIGRERFAEAVVQELPALAPPQVGASPDAGASAIAAAAPTPGLSQALAAFDAMAEHAGLVRESGEASAKDYAAPDWIDMPCDLAATAAPDIHAAATSALAKTGAWRTTKPVIDDARCKRCSWICSTFCPDSAITVVADHVPRIDYDHCKGCMICVAVCPAHAIEAVPERRMAA